MRGLCGAEALSLEPGLVLVLRVCRGRGGGGEGGDDIVLGHGCGVYAGALDAGALVLVLAACLPWSGRRGADGVLIRR